nr:hypothetical protein [Schaalia odontolytica]
MAFSMSTPCCLSNDETDNTTARRLSRALETNDTTAGKKDAKIGRFERAKAMPVSAPH